MLSIGDTKKERLNHGTCPQAAYTLLWGTNVKITKINKGCTCVYYTCMYIYTLSIRMCIYIHTHIYIHTCMLLCTLYVYIRVLLFVLCFLTGPMTPWAMCGLMCKLNLRERGCTKSSASLFLPVSLTSSSKTKVKPTSDGSASSG